MADSGTTAAQSSEAHEPARRGGRPSRADAARLAETIVAVATTLFFEQGYGATSVEAVAQAARISKRTFYSRFADKAALFAAVVHRIVGTLRPTEVPSLFEGDAVTVLRRIAGIMVHTSVAPTALALHRLTVAESLRFPELAGVVAAEGARAEAVARIAELLRRETVAGRFQVADPEFAAEQFIQLVVSVPQRRALGLGTPMTAAEREAWAEKAQTLFLNGVRIAGV
jgi:AcrR family transcriptional regulator